MPHEQAGGFLPGCTVIVLAASKTGKSTFTPRNTITGKGVAYVRPFDKTLSIVKSIESHVIHRLELPIQVQDLVKAYQTSTCFQDVYHYIKDAKLPSGAKAQACFWAEALNYVVINNFPFRIDT